MHVQMLVDKRLPQISPILFLNWRYLSIFLQQMALIDRYYVSLGSCHCKQGKIIGHVLSEVMQRPSNHIQTDHIAFAYPS